MHISDGILPPIWAAAWYLVAAFFLAACVRRVRNRTEDDPGYTATLGLMGAAVFVISVWHIPVAVTGSSSHPIGTPMSAVVVGPFATTLLSSIALFLHMFLAHGGVTTLGANTVSMGVAGGFVGYGAYRSAGLMGASPFASGAAAGLAGSLATYMTTALILAAALHPGELLRFWAIFSMGFVPTQLPLSVAEAVSTGAVVRYVAHHRPELLGRFFPGGEPVDA
ncbi:MAG: Cobalt transport protein CbiM [Methanonatronarchaeales archaeon]|nr:Cobalt transport protein CbiM [Methanonatronarchaeales archaeon]